MKSSTQIKALIRNLAKEKEVNAQILLRNYMLERLLERISSSEYKDNFILKGGMLVAALVGVDMRSTIDMDATIKSFPVNRESIEAVFKMILAVPLDDGVEMKLKRIEEIRDEDQYNGYRVSIEAVMDNARIPIKVDITTGDEITPKEVIYTFDLLLENRSIDILAYNIETVIAEKFETILTRNITNTRMRDFYDIHILLKLQGHRVEPALLSEAVRKTAEKRGSVSTLSDGQAILEEVRLDDSLERHWVNYQRKNSYADDITWEDINVSLSELWKIISVNL
ncbi:nucleotidyl transferase AbiEii/AbiGii toxin family protein [Schinkia azotoformans]|uniref:nucleotidyl transferase AbiEii/AbiGii toxin family protein n=1 Tax=Schinkia azotoformans TaxID=1454 RepID=UPI002DBE36F4|nr:nucleotidyl transferase AbiEii/AbiGii toxin family protein [Schinkia azotoformans]MEC1771951.1 nucleotidyl transferase AbiEii/AbiGii toxin family protein [Schinkia azotoformans]MED4366449.1 nucleotidyl transferase AbiEii/AbiGii toxin family protein [Schinkia azotoformans]